MDSRILHVRKEYSQYEGLDPSVAVNLMHQQLYQEYKQQMDRMQMIGGISRGASGSKAAAAELQQFFQALKNYNMTGSFNDNALDEAAQDTIIQVMNGVSQGRYKKLFQSVASNKKQRHWQGEVFEKQLAEVLAVVRDLAAGGSSKRADIIAAAKSMNIGTRGKVQTDLSSLAQEEAEALISMSHSKLSDYFHQSKTSSELTQYTSKQVEGKIDLSGLMCEWKLSVEPTTYLYRIASLLSQANFTAKSYASFKMVYDKTIRERVQYISKNVKLNIGKTDLNRVFLDMFSSFQYPMPVSISMLMVLSHRGGKNDSIYEQLAALRFIYELTGYGQTYVNKIIEEALKANGDSLQGANYMIYNDPASNEIFVKSTAEIIIELWDSINKITERVVQIEKKYFI